MTYKHLNWENKYLELCREVLDTGVLQQTRVGPAYALYGKSLSIYPGKNGFPLLTTRRMHYKPVFGELAAFLKGYIFNNNFINEGCTYWGANAEAWDANDGITDARKLYLGLIYGFQWNNFNGVDQLKKVRRALREDPTSRRIILSTWNPEDLNKMCLPPCHIIAQFHVDGKYLICSVYMRSVDLALGLPSDIILYYALMIVLAEEASLVPVNLHFHFGNAHVYKVHEPKLKEQIQRVPDKGPDFIYHSNKRGFNQDCIDIYAYQPMEVIKYELLV